MNSKKVKEIKELLLRKAKEYESQTLLDILTLINELESENETIKLNIQETEKASFNINQMNGNLVLENQVLKDRIAELESENERLKILLAQANAGIVNCSGCKLVELNAVREFAERLKDKVKNFCGTEEENHYYDVSKKGEKNGNVKSSLDKY